MPLPICFTAAIACLVGAGPALAEGVGDIGLSFGLNSFSNEFSGFGRSGEAGFVGVDGSFTFRAAPRILLGFDAGWRADDVKSEPDFDFFGAPESQTMLAGRVLWEMSADTRLGGFLAYGDTNTRDMPSGQTFDYVLYGLEARHFVSDDLMLFGQLALGDDDGDGLSVGAAEGFNNGRSVRLGGTYFAGDRSAFTLDVEYATADPYIDGSDAGKFFGVTLGGETRLPVAAPLFATFALRTDRLDSTTENGLVQETTLGIGIRYVFGADSLRDAARAGRSIGTPVLPARASIWTNFLDD